jgi:nitrate/TMAO reductase-like tetraheme cytochrome c subunit
MPGDRLGLTLPVGLAVLGGVSVLLLVLALPEAGAYRAAMDDQAYCLSCHAMEEPVEAVAATAHDSLACADCHVPTLERRGQEALSVLAGSPPLPPGHDDAALATCVDCHIGDSADPDVRVDDLAGHRVHRESELPELAELTCLDCHAVDDHTFEASTQGCTAAGCHEDWNIRLGAMAHESMECGDCHDLDRVLARTDSVERALRPDESTCLECHEMAEVYEVPEHDPHEGDCGACHLPHEHTTVEQAATTCTDAGCHTRADTLTALHEGLLPGALQDCVSCHVAHSFSEMGDDCLSCHQDIYEDGVPVAVGPVAGPTISPGVGPGEGRGASAAGPGIARMVSGAVALLHRVPPSPAAWIRAVPAGIPGAGPVAPAVQVAGQEVGDTASEASIPGEIRDPDGVFRHGEHQEVDCLECHSTERRHGELTVITAADCRSCHHLDQANECAACHQNEGDEYGVGPIRRDVLFTFTVDREPFRRTLDFRHAEHEEVECTECHEGGLTLSAVAEDCTSCHEEHHEPERSCLECHQEAPESEHPAEVHVGCGGAECHKQATPFRFLAWSPSTCLGCHQDETDHYPESDDCTECHLLPRPRVPWNPEGGP